MMIGVHDRKRMSQKKKEKEAVVEVYQQVIGEQKLATISYMFLPMPGPRPVSLAFREFRTPFNQMRLQGAFSASASWWWCLLVTTCYLYIYYFRICVMICLFFILSRRMNMNELLRASSS